jgi:uncharacterized protein (DUF2461 family)
MHFLVSDSFNEHILLHVLWFQRVERVCDGCFYCCVCCCNCFLIVGHWKKRHGFLDATHRAEIEVRFFLFLGGLI